MDSAFINNLLINGVSGLWDDGMPPCWAFVVYVLQNQYGIELSDGHDSGHAEMSNTEASAAIKYELLDRSFAEEKYPVDGDIVLMGHSANAMRHAGVYAATRGIVQCTRRMHVFCSKPKMMINKGYKIEYYRKKDS